MGDTSANVTRRVLLGGVAAAGAASLVRPARGVAEALGARRSLSTAWVGTLSGESPAMLAPERFVLAGVQWLRPAAPAIELRAQAPDGRWSPWVPASVLGHDQDGPRSGPEAFGEPVWTGAADRLQLHTASPVSGLRVNFVSAPARPLARTAQALPLAQPTLDAGPGQPPIIARQAWAQGQATPGHAPEYGTVKLGFVHHTVNPNGYSAGEVPAMLLAIFDYHRFVRGFWDIAYNFVIDLYGRIWEARAGGIDMAVVGAQAGGYNLESTGVAVLGDFMSVVPSAAAVSALERLLAWKLSLHGIPTHGRVTVVVDPTDYFYTPFAPGAHVSLPRVAGHRDGDTTDCPGNAFYAELPSIRPRITALAGTPAQLTMTPPLTTAVAGTPFTASGLLRLRGGPPLAGAPLELQQLTINGLAVTTTTIATTTTAVDGSWSFPLTLQTNTTLRILHRPSPATVSDWMALSVLPVITLTVTSISPLQLTGTVSPSKGHVVIDVYASGRAHGKPVKSKRIRVAAGQFSTEITVLLPGSYVLVARTTGGPVNGASTSAPVGVTIA